MIQFPLVLNHKKIMSTDIYNEYKKSYNKEKTIQYIISCTQCTNQDAIDALEEILQLARPKNGEQIIKNQNAKVTDYSNSILCPKCNSRNNSLTTRGFSLIWGFIGSSSPRRICNQCGHKWKP